MTEPQKEKPKDFIEYHCKRCGDEEDYFPLPCICYATRDHKPDVCPADKEHRSAPWKPVKILFLAGEDERL